MGLATALKGAVADACHAHEPWSAAGLMINPVNSREFAKDVRSLRSPLLLEIHAIGIKPCKNCVPFSVSAVGSACRAARAAGAVLATVTI
jgi:hypothetical protein